MIPLILLAVGLTGRASAQAVYSTDFEAGAGAEWSSATVDTSVPDPFTAFSGRFGNQTQTLSLDGLTDGESYTLTYTMIIPGECHHVYGDPSCFGAVYRENYIILRGTISGNDLSTVPVPAAVWLFGSGLIGLAGIAVRKKA